MNDIPSLVLIGVGATVVMDAWGALRKSLFGIPPADYGMVGRWVGHMAHGKFRHERMAAASPIPGGHMTQPTQPGHCSVGRIVR